jgi:hypothetical protein
MSFDIVLVRAKNLIKIPFHTGAASIVLGICMEKSTYERPERSERRTYCFCALMHHNRALYAGTTLHSEYSLLLLYVKRDIFHESFRMQHFQLPSCPSTFSA